MVAMKKDIMNDDAVCRGSTSAQCAAYHNDVLMLEKLIELKCDVNKQDCRGNSALHVAVTFNNVEAVNCLLKPNADDQTKTRANTTLRTKMMVQNDKEKTAYMIAECYKYTELVKILKPYERVDEFLHY
jgi:ankyrin repeat protein